MDKNAIKKKAQELLPEIAEIRHHLHKNPEVSWAEIETSKFIKSRLEGLGLTGIRYGFAGQATGVAADLVTDPAAPMVALRADIDALALTEENPELEYRSCRDGAMHACGHDGHIAALLGAASILTALKDELPGNVRFLFQPAEEIGARSGAKAMIAEGVLEGVGAIGGLHLWSFVETGKVQWRNGPIMASADGWNLTFTGKGGHGAMPHNTIDPTVAAADFIGAVQTIVSREIDPAETAVVSLGQLNAGSAFNIIPETVKLIGNIRTFNPAVRAGMEGRLRRIADGIAAAYRCRADLGIDPMYSPLINHEGPTELLKECAVELFGPEMVEESPRYMVSEDYSFYLEKVPGTFCFIGCGNRAKNTDHPHHSPKFNVDDKALVTAMPLLSLYAVETLKKLRSGGF